MFQRPGSVVAGAAAPDQRWLQRCSMGVAAGEVAGAAGFGSRGDGGCHGLVCGSLVGWSVYSRRAQGVATSSESSAPTVCRGRR